MTGQQGEQGEQGEQGDKGARGEQGDKGITGEIGKLGLKGNQGNQGNQGFRGQQGTQGTPGPSQTNRVRVIAGFVVLIFLVLSVRQEISDHRQSAAIRRINENTAAISEIQTRTSEDVLCPLYVLFLGSVKNPDPKDVDTPGEREKYAGYLKIIQSGYDKLGCPAP